MIFKFMYFWRKKKIREEAEICELETHLLAMNKVKLEHSQNQKMRKHLLQMIDQFSAEESAPSQLFHLQWLSLSSLNFQ